MKSLFQRNMTKAAVMKSKDELKKKDSSLFSFTYFQTTEKNSKRSNENHYAKKNREWGRSSS